MFPALKKQILYAKIGTFIAPWDGYGAGHFVAEPSYFADLVLWAISRKLQV